MCLFTSVFWNLLTCPCGKIRVHLFAIQIYIYMCVYMNKYKSLNIVEKSLREKSKRTDRPKIRKKNDERMKHLIQLPIFIYQFTATEEEIDFTWICVLSSLNSIRKTHHHQQQQRFLTGNHAVPNRTEKKFIPSFP